MAEVVKPIKVSEAMKAVGMASAANTRRTMISRTVVVEDQYGSWVEINMQADHVNLRTKRGQVMALDNAIDIDTVIDILTEAKGRLT